MAKEHCPNCGGELPPDVSAKSIPLTTESGLLATRHDAPCQCGSQLPSDEPPPKEG